MSNAPAGWYPQADGRHRYWDGERWTEHFAPGSPAAPAPTPQIPGEQIAEPAEYNMPSGRPSSAQAQPSGHFPPHAAAVQRPWYAKKRFLIPGALVGFFFFIGIVGAISGGDEDPDLAGAAADTPSAPVAIASASVTQDAATPVPAPSETPTTHAPVAPPQNPAQGGEYGPQPAAQRGVVAAVIAAQAASEDADNDLARGAALRTRTAAICKAIPKRVATNWSGKVVTLDANGDGKGVVEIEIAPDVIVKTWNNSLSDISDETLIEPSDPLFDKVLKLQEDQVVTFSGKFPSDDANCIRENSVTLRGSLATPGFIMKFSDVN